MSCVYFLKYKTAGGWDALFNPDNISHVYQKCGLTILVMTNGYEYSFDSTMEAFIERLAKDMSDATSHL